MTSIRASSFLAADITGVDRLRFNEAVSEGFYPCVPPSGRGKTRSFGVIDLLVLKIYGILLSEGMTPRFAGPMACKLLGLLQQYPDADIVAHVRAQTGEPFWCRHDMVEIALAMHRGGLLVSKREWHLRPMREDIICRLEEEDANRVVGPVGDDE